MTALLPNLTTTLFLRRAFEAWRRVHPSRPMLVWVTSVGGADTGKLLRVTQVLTECAVGSTSFVEPFIVNTAINMSNVASIRLSDEAALIMDAAYSVPEKEEV